MGFMGPFLRLIYWFVILFDKVDSDLRCSKRRPLENALEDKNVYQGRLSTAIL
jgi:hypothetical protein